MERTKKFVEMLEKMNHEELMHFEKEYKRGAIAKLINRKKEELKNIHYCSVCGNEIKTEGYELIFGENIRKRARFCAQDCMEYFVKNLKRFEGREK